VNTVSQDDPIRIFACHAFQDQDDYHRFFEYLESATNFFYSNTAVPGKVPEVDTTEAFRDEIREQIKPAEIVVILAGMYDEAREWVEFTLLAAQAFEKPIIAMEHFGSTQEVAQEVASVANEVVPWNDRLMVDALRRQARHEETQRWDVVEFDMPETPEDT